MTRDLVFEGLRINHGMTFERLLPQLSQESATRISQWWKDLAHGDRELIDQLIDLAYVISRDTAGAEISFLLSEWRRGK